VEGVGDDLGFSTTGGHHVDAGSMGLAGEEAYAGAAL
jgi:hypothetical protein